MPYKPQAREGQNRDSGNRKNFRGKTEQHACESEFAASPALEEGQDLRWRVADIIELTTDNATRATIAKVRIITTTEYSLLKHRKEGQVGFQIQPVSFQLDEERSGKVMPSGLDNCRSKRTFCR